MTFRIVGSNENELKTTTVAAAAHAAIDAAISDKAMAFLIIYESPEGNKHHTIPNLNCVRDGLIMRAQDIMFDSE